jgi:hypothetical protein
MLRVVVFVSCVILQTHPLFAAEDACTGKSCRLVGVLDVYAGGYGAARITSGGNCYDLALPSEIFRESDKWDRKTVELSGYATVRPNVSNLEWYQIKDRRMEATGCSNTVVYVRTIRRK